MARVGDEMDLGGPAQRDEQQEPEPVGHAPADGIEEEGHRQAHHHRDGHHDGGIDGHPDHRRPERLIAQCAHEVVESRERRLRCAEPEPVWGEEFLAVLAHERAEQCI